MATVKIAAAVDASAFVSFYDVFQQYRAALDEQPDAWKKVGQSTDGIRDDFSSAAKSLRNVADAMDDVLERSKSLDRTSEKTARSWSSMAKATKDAAGNIKDATVELLRWTGVIGLVSGLAGGGALFGMESLAGSVSAARSAAMGTGTTYGGRAAFRTNFGRLGDTDSILGSINEATHDYSKRRGLQAIGMSPEQIDQGDTANVAADAVLALKDWVDKVPEASLGNRLTASGADQTFSLQTAEEIKHMRRDEVVSLVEKMRADRPKMELDPQTQRHWQELSTQLDRAKTQIETIFVKELVALAPGIAHLSDSFTKTVQALLKENGPVSQWLGEFNVGLEHLSKVIDTPEFKTGVEDFMKSLGEIAKELWKAGKAVAGVVHWFAQLLGTTADSASETAPTDPNAVAPAPIQHSDRLPGAGLGTGLRAGRQAPDGGGQSPSGGSGGGSDGNGGGQEAGAGGGGRSSGGSRRRNTDSSDSGGNDSDGNDGGGTWRARRGGSHGTGMPPGDGGGSYDGPDKKRGRWWTDERVKHAYDRLVDGGMNPKAAEGLIARWAYVESPNGPTSRNFIGGGHHGIFQADRVRQRDYGGSDDFDAQLDAVNKERLSTEKVAGRTMANAKTDFDAARAASMFERAEGYAARHDGTDNWTGVTQKYVPTIHDIVDRPSQKPPAAMRTAPRDSGQTPDVPNPKQSADAGHAYVRPTTILISPQAGGNIAVQSNSAAHPQ